MFNATFWLNPSDGGAVTPPENCPIKLFRSKAGVKVRSDRFTVPPRSALSVVPVSRR